MATTTNQTYQMIKCIERCVIHIGMGVIFLLLALTKFMDEILRYFDLVFKYALEKLSERLEDTMKQESFSSTFSSKSAASTKEKTDSNESNKTSPSPTYQQYSVRNMEAITETEWECDGKIINIKEKNVKFHLLGKLEVTYCRAPATFIPNAISTLIPSISLNYITELNLIDQRLTWNEYKLITSSPFLEILYLVGASIYNADGTFATLDKYLECLINPVEFKMWGFDEKEFQSDTVKKMVKMFPRFTKLHRLSLITLPETFDFASITEFLMKNETIEFELLFSGTQSDAYEQMLQEFIDKLIANPPKKVPYIFNHLVEKDKNKFAEYLKLITDEKFKKQAERDLKQCITLEGINTILKSMTY